MEYVDYGYMCYYAPNIVHEADLTELSLLMRRASDVIDILTMHKIGGRAGFNSLPRHLQKAIQKATAAQVETMYYAGGLDTVTGAQPQSVTVGKFSYSAAGTAGETVGGIPLSPLARGYLAPTGLLYRGIG